MIASPIDLLMTELDRRGVTLLADDGRLRFHPASVVDAALLERLRLHKADLLERLAPPAPVVNTSPSTKCNRHDWRKYQAKPIANRPGWESVTCGDCSAWLANRPVKEAKQLEVD